MNQGVQCRIALEPAGYYHRALARPLHNAHLQRRRDLVMVAIGQVGYDCGQPMAVCDHMQRTGNA